jgi:chemotaxis protein MotB
MVKKLERKKSIVPMWYVTFADLSTLMLTFFVLLLSFANFDIVKFRDMLGSVQGAFGVVEKKEGKAVAYLTGEDAFERDEEKKETEKLSPEDKADIEADMKGIEKLVEDSDLNESATIFTRKNELVVRIDAGALFTSGSAAIRRRSHKLLKGVADLMKRTDYYMTVEGHTDNVPISTEEFPSNWELSGVRATTILRHMVRAGVDIDRFRALGYADTRPITDNVTEEGRRKNRRVEFVLKKITQKEPEDGKEESRFDDFVKGPQG